MNDELGLRLQAYLDGELSHREAKKVSRLVAENSEASALLEELRSVKAAMAGNEIELKLPEAREFFWTKIQREIVRLEQRGESRPAVSWWTIFRRKYLMTVSGVGVAAALLLMTLVQFKWVSPEIFEEIENPLEDTGTLSFRSESQKITVVWLMGKEDLQQQDFMDDMGEQ